jgi:hypothetical protein
VLTLASYDVVLGMDWLEVFSPMQIHWQEKWISIPFQGVQTILFADQSEVHSQSLLHIEPIPSTKSDSAVVDSLPAPIQQLLLEFEGLFQPPTTLPLSCSCNHQIPLIPRA